MNMKKGVTRFLLSHAGKNPVSFHMPGHKGMAIYRENGYGDFLDNFVDCDITGIPGADNLYQAEDIIADTMAKYRALYGVSGYRQRNADGSVYGSKERC